MRVAQELQVSFIHGKAYAAYFTFSREIGAKVHHTTPFTDDLIVDYNADGRPYGIEILNPGKVDPAELAELLARLNLPPELIDEFEPVLARSPNIKT